MRIGFINWREEERFQRDVISHVGAAYNFARWLVGNDADAEDAVQEATIKAFKGFRSHRGSDPKSWFLAIVRNNCLNLLRSRNRRNEVVDEDDLASAEATSLGPAEKVFKAFDGEVLRRAIEELPPVWRETIILREFEHMSYREIAEVAGVPVGTVMSRLARARERLRDLICEEGGA